MDRDLSHELSRNIPLHEMIQTLRQELAASVESARGQALQLEVGEVELELKLQLTREQSVEGGGGIKFWVVEATGEGKVARTDAQTHTFKLKLKPSHRGGPVRVAGEDER